MSCTHGDKTQIMATGGKLIVCKQCLGNIAFEPFAPSKKVSVSLEPKDRLSAKEIVEQLKDKQVDDFARSFLDSFSTRVKQYGEKVFISEKQQAVLDRIQFEFIGKAGDVDCPF